MNKLIRVIKYYIPSKEALRNTEVTISTIQDLYNQCMEFINYLGDVAIQLSREGDGYYKILDEVPQVGEGNININVKGETIATFNVNSPIDSDIDLPLPTYISDLINDEGFISSDDLIEALAGYAKTQDIIADFYTKDEITELISDFITIASVPTKVSQLQNDVGYLTTHQDISGKVDRSELAEVATSGDYNDLDNLPAIPVLPDFATVALTGEYNDLLHKPTIPTVPTNVSAFNNDAGYLTAHQSLDNYYTKQQIDNKGYLTEHQDISGKVDKETGKGLSSNDYTTTEKNKLAGIAAGAEVNVNADWNATAGDAEILNKPSIPVVPTNVSAFNNDAGYLTQHQEVAPKTAAIPYAQVDATSTSTVYTATVPGITELKDGVCVMLRNGHVTSAANFTLNINNLGAKPAYNSMATGATPTRDTTIFNVNYTMLFVYSTTIVSGGGWICYRGYDANTNTLGYQIRTNNSVRKTSDNFRYYKILFSSADDTNWVPAAVSTVNSATSAKTVNVRPINPFGEIVYVANTTNYTAGSSVGATAIWQQYTLTLGYSFNRTGAALTLQNPAPVYVKCTPLADGSAVMDPDHPYVQDLPSTDDGSIYIYLGMAYSATAIELSINHPVYWHDGEGIRLWTGKKPSNGGGLNIPSIGIYGISYQDLNTFTVPTEVITDLVNTVGNSYSGIIGVWYNSGINLGFIDFDLDNEIFYIDVPIAFGELVSSLDSSDLDSFMDANPGCDAAGSICLLRINFSYTFE